MKAITVNGLLKECQRLEKMGYGDKVVLLSDDDEGNGFHTLFYTFETDIQSIETYANEGLFHDDNDPSTVVILG